MRPTRRLIALAATVALLSTITAAVVASRSPDATRISTAADVTPAFSIPASVAPRPGPATAPTVPPPTSSSSTSTVAAPATTSAPVVLAVGSSGPEVADLELRLAELGFWVGAVDDVYDTDTAHAVTAFEKTAGLDRDGIAGPQVAAAMANATRPAGRSVAGDLIEIDVTRQILILVRNGRTDVVFDTSTGKPSTPTALGRFEIEREIDGYHRSRLGVLYRPKYFHGGQAIHGYPNVPPYAASHGCVRLTNNAIDWLWREARATIGTEVWVYS